MPFSKLPSFRLGLYLTTPQAILKLKFQNLFFYPLEIPLLTIAICFDFVITFLLRQRMNNHPLTFNLLLGILNVAYKASS